MTITAVDNVQYRPFRGYDDPALPTGTWFGRVQLVGDGSGGLMTAELDFTLATDAFNSRFYSLEDISCNKNENTAVDASIVILNMGDRGHSGNTPVFAANFLVGTAAAALSPADVTAMRGRWLGQQITGDTLAAVRLTQANSNAILVTLFMEGYFWSARAVNAAGGPSKPLQGLYSH